MAGRIGLKHKIGDMRQFILNWADGKGACDIRHIAAKSGPPVDHQQIAGR